MALNSDFAFKFGCGRYLQEKDAIKKHLLTELRRFGSKALFISGKNGFKAAGEKIKDSLNDSGFEYELKIFESTPCFENADEFVNYAKENGFNIICGVGGGVLGDTAKLVASRADLPLIQIPTSSATCVAATPLSVLYDRETHATIGSVKLMTEADAVIVDLDIMINQPKRLFWAGVMDSMAKMIEITHRTKGKKDFEIPLGLEMAYDMSKTVYNFFYEKQTSLSSALEGKNITFDFERAVFYAIAVTGIISGISKGSNQCAIAHKFYEQTRSFFYEETKDFVHGELVALGLVIQLAYNELDYQAMIDLLDKMKLPTKMSGINLKICDETLETFVNELSASTAIMDTSDISKNKVKKALLTIYK